MLYHANPLSASDVNSRHDDVIGCNGCSASYRKLLPHHIVFL